MRVLLQRILLAVALSFSFGTGPSAALDPSLGIEQFHHRTWTPHEGVPDGVAHITQAPDGFLWLGASSGLYRFDGIRATPVSALAGEVIYALNASPNGDVWSGLTRARLVRVRRGVATFFDVPTSEYKSEIDYIAPDGDSSIWVGSRDEVFHFDGQHWRLIGSPWPRASTFSDPGGVWGMAVARDGTVWTKNLLGLYYLRRGANAFEQAQGYGGSIIDFAHAADGRIWTADAVTRRFYALPELVAGRAVAAPMFGAPVPPLMLGAVTMDRDGALWDANRVTGGFYRLASVTAPTALERYTPPQGLLSDAVHEVFEDREGNIWVGNEAGIERFRSANVVAEPGLPLRDQAAHIIAANGSLYFYSGMGARVTDPNDVGRRLYRIGANGAHELLAPDFGQVQAMAAAPDGTLVFAADGRLARWRDGIVTPIATPSDIAGGHVYNLVATRDGSLWVSFHDRGVWRLSGRQWTHVTVPAASPTAPAPLAIDGRGDVWLFYEDGPIVRFDGDRMAEFPSIDSEVGRVQATVPDGDGFILVGVRGVARFDGRAFQFITSSRAPPLALPFGVTTTADGDVWIGANAGVLRITRASLLRALADPRAPLAFRMFDQTDGFVNSALGDAVNGQMTTGPDGRVWLLMHNRVAWIDPRKLNHNARAPPVEITSITGNGRSYDVANGVQLPPGTAQIHVEYAGLSFVAPERLRFRYKLSGVDENWVEAQGRREAFYTNIPPGEHRFQVIAANDDGVWNNAGASIAITLAPTFVQSAWFKALMVLALLAALSGVYLLRMRQEMARMQGLFDTRIAERERIARELHDTLLQAIQGLMLRFQTVADDIPEPSEKRTVLNAALDRAEAVLVEGRSRVRELRTEANGDLAQAVAEAAHAIIEGEAPRFELIVEGKPRALHALIGEEMRRVAEEAIRNASLHANAKKIEAVLSYERGGVRLTIRDDGVGMDPDPAAQHGDHFGLVGMRERAEGIGAKLSVMSGTQRGTDVELFVPARTAFGRRRDRLAKRIGSAWRGRAAS